MKPKSVRYAIQNPCDKSWNEMTPETDGRFCGSCEKSVIDFTRMSDFSIVNYLESHRNEKVCGRFTKPQLDRVYALNQPVFATSFDLKAVVLGLALTTFSAIHSFSQTGPQELINTDTTLVIPQLVVGTVTYANFDHSQEQKVSGTITNRLRSYSEVFVQLKNAKGRVLETVHADAKGNFEILLNWKKDPAYIEISAPGFETALRTFSSLSSLSDIRIELLEAPMIIGEVIQGETRQKDGKPEEDQILQKIEMGNVSIRKTEK
jgi:hypothetical protein